MGFRTREWFGPQRSINNSWWSVKQKVLAYARKLAYRWGPTQIILLWCIIWGPIRTCHIQRHALRPPPWLTHPWYPHSNLCCQQAASAWFNKHCCLDWVWIIVKLLFLDILLVLHLLCGWSPHQWCSWCFHCCFSSHCGMNTVQARNRSSERIVKFSQEFPKLHEKHKKYLRLESPKSRLVAAWTIIGRKFASLAQVWALK